MFERHRGRYVIGAGIAVLAGALVVAVPAIAAFPAHYEGLSIAEYFRLVAISAGAGCLFFAIMLWYHRAAIRALLRWSDTRDPTAEYQARRFAFDGPAQIGKFFGLLGQLGLPIVVLVIAEPRHHTAAVDLIELAIGAWK
jgi:hypothetical protein